MADVKTIKDIDEETWSEFKSMAAKNKLRLGSFFKIVLKEYKKTEEVFWKGILDGEKILSEKESEDIENIIKNIRKDKGFRI